MRESEAVYIVGLLGAAWSKQLSRETVGLYAQEIADEDYEVALAATRSLIRTREFFPPIAVLLEAIRKERADRAPGLAALPPSEEFVTLDELPEAERRAWDAVRALVAKWGGAS